MQDTDMNTDPTRAALDRHALVVSIWVAFGAVTLCLFDYGTSQGSIVAVALSFVAILAAFIAHILANTVLGADFTQREAFLGLTIYAVGIIGFLFFSLSNPQTDPLIQRVMLGGFVAIAAVVVFYLVIRFGLKQAFNKFDAIRVQR